MSFHGITLTHLSITSTKKAYSRSRPFCIVQDFISLSYLRQGFSNTTVCLIQFFYSTQEISRRTIDANLIFELDQGPYLCPLFSTYTRGGGSNLPPPPPKSSYAFCCHICKIYVYTAPIKITHSFRRLGIPRTVILVRVSREATPNDECGSLPIKLGHPRHTQTDCEIRHGKQ